MKKFQAYLAQLFQIHKALAQANMPPDGLLHSKRQGTEILPLHVDCWNLILHFPALLWHTFQKSQMTYKNPKIK